MSEQRRTKARRWIHISGAGWIKGVMLAAPVWVAVCAIHRGVKGSVRVRASECRCKMVACKEEAQTWLTEDPRKRAERMQLAAGAGQLGVRPTPRLAGLQRMHRRAAKDAQDSGFRSKGSVGRATVDRGAEWGDWDATSGRGIHAKQQGCNTHRSSVSNQGGPETHHRRGEPRWMQGAGLQRATFARLASGQTGSQHRTHSADAGHTIQTSRVHTTRSLFYSREILHRRGAPRRTKTARCPDDNVGGSREGLTLAMDWDVDILLVQEHRMAGPGLPGMQGLAMWMGWHEVLGCSCCEW